MRLGLGFATARSADVDFQGSRFFVRWGVFSYYISLTLWVCVRYYYTIWRMAYGLFFFFFVGLCFFVGYGMCRGGREVFRA